MHSTNDIYANTMKQFWLRGKLSDVPPLPDWNTLTLKPEPHVIVDELAAKRNKYRLKPTIMCRKCLVHFPRDKVLFVSTNYPLCIKHFREREAKIAGRK